MAYIIDELYRFRMLVGGVYLGVAISSSYGFSIFTEYLKSKYGFTQSDINTISTVGNCVGYLNFFAGMLFDFIGPKIVIFVAGCLGCLGFLLYGLAFDDVIPNNDNKQLMLVQFCVFNTILYLGCPSLDVCALMSLMLNYPLERGYMVIIQKTFSGLGTAVIMAYFNAWFNNSNGPLYSSYAYFLSAQFAICALVGIFTIDLPPYYMCDYTKKRVSEEEKLEREETRNCYMTQHAPKHRLLLGCILVVMVLIFTVVTSVVMRTVNVSQKGCFLIGIVALLLVLLFMMIALPFQIVGRYTPIRVPHPKFRALGLPDEKSMPNPMLKQSGSERQSDYENTVAQSDIIHFQTPSVKARETDPQVCSLSYPYAEALDDQPQSEKQSTPIEDPQFHGSFWGHLLTLELWLLWVFFFGVWGTATVMIMNAAQLYRSINQGEISNTRLTLYITIISLGSAIGRLFSGIIDMWMINRRQQGLRTVPMTAFLPLSAICLTVGYFLFSVIPPEGLVLPFLLVALGNGLGWGLGSLTIRIIYAEDLGKHYNFMFFSGFVCTIGLNRFMFGGMYDKKAEMYGTSPACNHPDCVRPQLWILMSVNILSLLASAILHFRFKKFIQSATSRSMEAT